MAPDSDLYPTQLYRDPLLFPLYVRTNNWHSIWTQVQGDMLLNPYIVKLDEEICDNIPEFRDHKSMVTELFDTTRIFGWAVIQFYDSEDMPYRIFGPLHKEDWIKEYDEEGKIKRVGLKAIWYDDLGNTWKDECRFGEDCYLFIWEKGNGIARSQMPPDTMFAIGDINLTLLTLAISARQIKGEANFSSSRPGFKHFVYGESITLDNRLAIQNNIQYANQSNGFGAKKSTVEEIRTIEDNVIEKCLAALKDEIQFFAGASRLPLSFYLGEKQTGGLGDTGESTDEVKVSVKKEAVLNHFLPQLQVMFQEQYGLSLPEDLGRCYSDKLQKQEEARQAEEQQYIDVMKQSRANQGKNNEEVKTHG